MSTLALSRYAFLITSSCVAVFKRNRTVIALCAAAIMLFLADIFTGGSTLLRYAVIGSVALGLSAAVSFGFRAFLVAVSPDKWAKEFRSLTLSASFGLIVIVLVLFTMVFAPWIAPYDQSEIVTSAFAPPDSNLWLGADQLGRDMFSRLIYGARNSVSLAMAATSAAFLIGTTAGLFAALKGGWIDQVLGRVTDIVISIPALIFALLMLSIFGPKSTVIIVAVAVVYAPRAFRVTRAVAGGVVAMDYVEAARLRGESTGYLIRKEVLPNCSAPLLAEFGMEFCFVFLLVAGLSFLGLGIQPPFADWGSMVRENATLISFGEITPLIPASCIAILTVGVNFVVDWMLHRSSGLKD